MQIIKWTMRCVIIWLGAIAIAPPLAAKFPVSDGCVVITDPRAPSDVAYDTFEEIIWRLGDRLHGDGNVVSVEPLYVGEVFSNTRGGITTNDATQYFALLELPFEFDFEKTSIPLPGKFFLLAGNTHGRGLTEDIVGDAQVLSNIDSFNNIMRVLEYWWELDFFDERVTVRLGKQDVNTEFLFIDLADDFVQSTFQLSPSTAFPTYPDPSMGAVLLLQPNDKWRLKLGVWDAFSSGGNWGFSGNDTFLVIGELEYKYALAGGSLPGLVVVGGAYESAGALEGVPISAVQEYIFQCEQWVYRENPFDDRDLQGLGLFVGYYPRFPGELVSPESIGDSYVVGGIYRGLLPFRDRDVCGVGLAYTELFGGGTNEETAVEVFYEAKLTPRLNLQPDLQYIASPSGVERDALVFGVRFELSF